MPRYFLQKHLRILKLSRANYMHSDAASQGGWWQGCGAAYKPTRIVMHTASNVSIFQP